MKKIIYISLLFTFFGLSTALAQISNSDHEHETDPPEPQETIRMEKKHAKTHEKRVAKEKIRHTRHNLKMERYRIRHTSPATYSAIGYDGHSKGKSHKKSRSK